MFATEDSEHDVHEFILHPKDFNVSLCGADMEEDLARRIASRSLLLAEGRDFTLASGQTSNRFCDLKPAMLDPHTSSRITDGLLDIITGKRSWAHGPKGEQEPGAPAVLYWFELTRKGKTVEYIPHQIDDNSGVGTQVAAGDVNGDGLLDIVVGYKKGAFVHLHSVKKVSKKEWQAAQPKRIH